MNRFNPLPLLVSLIVVLLAGCSTARTALTTPPSPPPAPRQFDFQKDSFAFANELVWEYHFDPASGRVSHSKSPGHHLYTHRCFVLARASRQFFQHARFDPALPKSSEAEYRRAVRKILSRSSARPSSPQDLVSIPGYPDLRSFSQEQEELLKSASAGAWRSYLQRGHWRILLPFSRRHQTRVSERFLQTVRPENPVIAHLILFPGLSINHAVVLYAGDSNETEIQFTAYDPNQPDHPILLTFDRANRTFIFPRTNYFSGGRVDVYEVYHGWLY